MSHQTTFQVELDQDIIAEKNDEELKQFFTDQVVPTLVRCTTTIRQVSRATPRDGSVSGSCTATTTPSGSVQGSCNVTGTWHF